jgi:hypothetical protein
MNALIKTKGRKVSEESRNKLILFPSRTEGEERRAYIA